MATANIDGLLIPLYDLHANTLQLFSRGVCHEEEEVNSVE